MVQVHFGVVHCLFCFQPASEEGIADVRQCEAGNAPCEQAVWSRTNRSSLEGIEILGLANIRCEQ